jgi:hypothetical protein
VLGSNFTKVGQPVTAPTGSTTTAVAPQGEDARTAADTKCIN